MKALPIIGMQKGCLEKYGEGLFEKWKLSLEEKGIAIM